MNISNNYYTIISYSTDSNKPSQKWIFDNFDLPIRFRRQNAIDKFLELNKTNNNIKLVFNEYYLQQSVVEGDCMRIIENDLLKIENGNLKIEYSNLNAESKMYMKYGEPIFGKVVIVNMPNGNSVEIIDDKLCLDLGIDFEYFEWD